MGAGFLLVGVGEAQLISTVTGNGTGSYLGDGSAEMAAQLNTPKGVWVDSTGDVFIADTGNHVDRGRCREYLGHGRLTSPNGIIGTPNGDLYIADWGNHTIRKLDRANGDLTTVAGTLCGGTVYQTAFFYFAVLLPLKASTKRKKSSRVIWPSSFRSKAGSQSG